MRLDRRPVLTLFIAGLLLQAGALGFAWQRTGRIDGFAFRSLDSGEYYAIARNLVEHGAFSQSNSPPYRPDTWRTPGYPLFLAAIMGLAGPSPSRLVIAQQLLAVANVVLLYRVARGCLGSRRAWIAALIFLLEPYRVYDSLWLLSTTLFVTALLLVWLAWDHAIRGGGLRWFIALGAAAGLLVLVRPLGIVIPLVVFIGLIIGVSCKNKFANTRWRWSCLPAFVLACAIPWGGWMMRNQLSAGRFALTDQSGVVLAYFKAAEVELWRQGRAEDRYLETALDQNHHREPHPVWEAIDARVRERFAHLPEETRNTLHWRNLAQGNKTSIDSFIISDELTRIGSDLLLASPFSAIAVGLIGCGEILTFPLTLAIKPPRSVPGIGWRSALLGTAYTLLALAVVVRLFRRGLTWRAAYFPLACTMGLLLMSTPQTDPRFRIPMIPLLAVSALTPKNEPRNKEALHGERTG